MDVSKRAAYDLSSSFWYAQKFLKEGEKICRLMFHLLLTFLTGGLWMVYQATKLFK